MLDVPRLTGVMQFCPGGASGPQSEANNMRLRANTGELFVVQYGWSRLRAGFSQLRQWACPWLRRIPEGVRRPAAGRGRKGRQDSRTAGRQDGDDGGRS